MSNTILIIEKIVSSQMVLFSWLMNLSKFGTKNLKMGNIFNLEKRGVKYEIIQMAITSLEHVDGKLTIGLEQNISETFMWANGNIRD